MTDTRQNKKHQHNKPQIASGLSFKQRALFVVVATVGICVGIGLYGMSLSARISEFDTQWTEYEQRTSAASFSLGLMKSHFGYGGFIHNFKNFVLRKDLSLIGHIENDLRDTYEAIENYPVDNDHDETTAAIADIRGVVGRYAEQLILAKKLILEGKSSTFIDKQVRVDDSPATDAFQFLSQHILQHSQEQKFKTAQAVDQMLGLLSLGMLLLPGVLVIGGVIVVFIRYNLRINQKLENTSQYLNDLFEAAPDVMLIVDTTGSITNANKRATELFGYSQNQFRTLNVEDLIPARFRKQHVKIREGAFKNPERRDLDPNTEFNALTRDGKEVPVEISLNYTIKDGERQAITTLRDITERKQIQTALLHHQNMLNKAQQIAHVGSWEWNICTEKLIWSEEIYRIFGRSVEEFGATYQSFVQYIHEEDRNAVVNAVNEAVVYDKPYCIDHRVVRPDGEVRYVQERGDVFRNEEGDAQYMVGTMLDITEQKEAEKELRLAENVFNHTSECILVTDERNRILRVNQAFTIVTGYTQEEIIGTTPKDFMQSGEQDLEFYAHMWYAILGRGFWEGELWDKRKDGTLFPCWHNISVIKDDTGKIIQFTSIFRDITDKKLQKSISSILHSLIS